MKVPISQISKKLMEYSERRREQRVGQFLMNELVPKAKDSEIFYEKDQVKAVSMFISRFGIPESKEEIVCHFRPHNVNVSACGIVNPAMSAYDGRDVDCPKCMDTDAWRKYMGKGEYR